MSFYFSKEFRCYILGQVEYFKCNNCGYTISKTHKELTHKTWKELNNQYHKSYQGKDFNVDDPKWQQRLHAQADILADLVKLGLLKKTDRWLDYGSGDGKLARILKDRYHIDLQNYDRYMSAGQVYLTTSDLIRESFDLVITTSVFEHFVKRADYDFIVSLVSSNGMLGLHTLVCEEIPKDPKWFYLLPVHSAFFTNKGMSILFEHWGYESSIYNIESRLWFWFKTESKEIQSIINHANKRVNSPKYVFKKGFVDYWK